MNVFKKHIGEAAMDIRQLKYFLAIVQEGQFTKAAKKLNITQPPMSQQIKQLEDEIGMQLFIRESRSVILTEAGNILRVRAEQILNLVESTTKELSDFKNAEQGTLKIGTVASSGAFILPKYISDFHDKYPDVTFQILEGDTYKIMELLNNGIVDIGIVRSPFPKENYNCMFSPPDSYSNPMVAVFDQKWDIKTKSKSIKLNVLKSKPLIINKRYENYIVQSCKAEGFMPNILCRSDDVRSMLSLAKSAIGIAIIPKLTTTEAEYENMKHLDIDEDTLITKTAIIWLKNTYLSTVAKNFINNTSKLKLHI